MPTFTFETETPTHRIPGYITPFLRVVGYNALRDRVTALRRRMRVNMFAELLLAERHALEFEVWKVVDRYRTYGRLPRAQIQGAINRGSFRAYDFMVILAHVHENLSDQGRRRLEGRVRHAFTDENDLSSLAQEMGIIGNLMRFGCAVRCHDLEDGGGYDFLASRKGIEFEVEGKVISPDKGRQIHQYDGLAFAEHFLPQLDWNWFAAQRRGALVQVQVPSRLSRNPVILDELGHSVVEALRTGANLMTPHGEARPIAFGLANTPFEAGRQQDNQAIRTYIQQLSGVDNDRLLIRAQPGRAALVVSLQSRKPDKVVSWAYESLKEGAEQLSGTRPGILVATFSDMPGEDLVDLARNVPNNGFQAITTRLFRSDARRHVYAVHYLGQLEYNLTPGGAIGATGPVYRFFNTNSPHVGDERLRMDPH